MTKKKLKILHIILSKGFAGSEKYVVDLVQFQKKKHFVSLISSKKNITLNKILKNKINVFGIGNLFRKLKIKKLINNIDPDIIHTHF